MPDTGAPWNIPYADPTDLVRDWPALSEDVADAVADALDAAAVGLGTNVVTATTSTAYTITSGTYGDLAGLSVTITPSTATAKVLLIVTITGSVGAIAGDGGEFRINGGQAATPTAGMIQIGTRATDFLLTNGIIGYSRVHLDSPASATAQTYQLQARAISGTMYVNRNGSNNFLGTSSITAIEVRA